MLTEQSTRLLSDEKCIALETNTHLKALLPDNLVCGYWYGDMYGDGFDDSPSISISDGCSLRRYVLDQDVTNDTVSNI